MYAIPVERDFIYAYMIEPPKAVERTFRVTFTCPINTKPFAATLRLTETSLDRIRFVGKPELKKAVEAEDESGE